jgi:multidrug efflux pump subunit AcrA (membrane-fusion protein)
MLLALASGCGRESSPIATAGGGGPPPAVVEVVTVEASPMVDVLDLVGQLESDESVEIRPEVDGLIESVEFTEGQEVKQGTVLFMLRDDEQRARLHEAEANAALADEVFRRTTLLAKQNIAAAAARPCRADLVGRARSNGRSSSSVRGARALRRRLGVRRASPAIA